jgi:hypothetical protein
MTKTDFNPHKGRITDEEGNVWQVLDENGEYDDAATVAAYDEGRGPPTHPKPQD